MTDRCCENCGWSEAIGSPIMCNYNGHRTFRDEVCQAWKQKEEKTNMVEIVRCKDCKRSSPSAQFCYEWYQPTRPNGYCHKAKVKDGEQK